MLAGQTNGKASRQAPLPTGQADSGIGTARPEFVASSTVGETAAPPIPTVNPSQFGAAPNWAANKAPLQEAAPSAGK